MTPDRWLVLSVRVPSEWLMEELAEGLLALGGAAVEETGDELTTYIPEPAEPDAFLRDASERLASLLGGEPEVSWRWQADEDWARRWKEGLEPRRVGERLVVTQPWNPVDAASGDVVLVVDPAMAFGTGEHATTRGALRLMEPCVGAGARVLDVGAGSAILAMAAAALGAAEVLAVESDPEAMDNARENVERNGVADRVRLINARVDDAWLAAKAGDGFDLIAANVLSGVLVPLLPAFAAALRPGGALVLGGILESEAAAVVTAASAAGLALDGEDREQEWWTGRLRAARA